MELDDCARLLEEVNAGNGRAFESLVSLVYGELRRMAGSLMRGRIDGRTLQPTALVNEAWLRLAQGEIHWDSKAHFFGAAVKGPSEGRSAPRSGPFKCETGRSRAGA